MTINCCIFCDIVSGKTSTPILFQDEKVSAFNDIHPITPVHILVVPNQHIDTLNETTDANDELLGHLVSVARRLAKESGIDEKGYRVVINTGSDAGQSVFHVHLHLIGGRRMPFKFQ